MNSLRELAVFVTKYKPDSFLLNAMPKLFQGKGKAGKLYKYLLTDNNINDNEAQNILYGNAEDTSTYRMLKKRLRDTLLIGICYLNFKANSKSFNSTYLVYKYIFFIRVLIMSGARQIGIKLAKYTLTLAKQFELYDAAYTCTRILRSDCIIEGNENDFVQYEKECIYFLEILKVENRLESIVSELTIPFSKGMTIKQELIEKSRKYKKEASKLSSKYSGYTINYYMLRIFILNCTIEGDFQQQLKLIHQAEKLLDDYPHFISNSRRSEFLLRKMVAYIALNMFDEAQLISEECEKLFNSNSFNWFVFKEYYFLLNMRKGNYLKALEITEYILQCTGFKDLTNIKQEKWKLLYCFCLCLLSEGKIKSMNINYILSEIKYYAKDKQGTRFLILLLPILYSMKKHPDSFLNKKVESLRRFGSRYFTGEEGRRYRLFIKLLYIKINLKLTKEAKYKVQNKTLHQLSSITPNIKDIDNFEIIPLEKLWQHFQVS